MKKIFQYIGMFILCGAMVYGQSGNSGQPTNTTQPNSGQQTSNPATNGGHDQTSSPETGQPGTGNVAGTGTGPGSGAEINGSPTAKKKSKKTKQTKSNTDKKEITPDKSNSPK
jgi:hypothetical protein